MARLPSLNALRAFEAAARHGSLTRAAAELHVTHSAVSHQIRALETEIGAPLLRRLGRGVQASAAGAELEAALTDAFGRIERAVERARGGDRSGNPDRQRGAVVRRALARAQAGAVSRRAPGDRAAPRRHHRRGRFHPRRRRRRDPPWARAMAGPRGGPPSAGADVPRLQPGTARPCCPAHNASRARALHPDPRGRRS